MPRNKHEWSFMGNAGPNTDHNSDLLYCPLCKRWAWGDDMKPFRMTYQEYERMHKEEEVDATAVLGPR